MFPHNRPGDARIAIGVAPIQFISVIQFHSPPISDGNGGTPLQKFLRPIHPEIIVHPASKNHLLLRRVPQRIMSRASLQFFLAVNDTSRVPGMLI